LNTVYFTRARIERFVEWGVLALLVAAALWRGGKGLEATWLLAGAAVIATFSSTKRVSATPGVWISLMLFVLWTVLSYLLSTTGNYGLDEVLRDTSLVLVFLWAVPLLEKGWDAPFARRLVTVLAITTLVCCAVGVAVYIFQPVNRFVGSFFYYRFSTDYWPNAWAEFVLLTWPVVMLWSRKFPTWLRVLLLGGVLGCLFLSFSRGAFLVFIVQIVLLASMRPRALLPLIGSGIIAVALFLGINAVRAGFHDVESVSAKATFTSSEGSSSISERRAFWEQSLRLSLVHPVVGWGPYSFRFIQPRLQTEVFATSDHPHNVFLKLALERGWPGMLFYLFALVGILVPAGVALLRRKRNDLILFAFIGIVGVFTHNLIDYNLQFVGIALPLWLFLAAVTASRTPAPAANK
jgi:O-antigen ligase